MKQVCFACWKLCVQDYSISRDILIGLVFLTLPSSIQITVKYCYSYGVSMDCNIHIISYANGKFDIKDAKDEPVNSFSVSGRPIVIRFLVLVMLGAGVEPLAYLIPELENIANQYSISSRQCQVVNTFNRLNIHHLLSRHQAHTHRRRGRTTQRAYHQPS